MMKAIVLGGCGAVGSNAVKTLVRTETFSEVVIGDVNTAKAAQMIEQLGAKLSAVEMDATDRTSIRKAITGCNLVVNCVGPFYSTVQRILETVIEERINYVDVCDDPDVTLEILKLDSAAKDAGILALIGMGASPGVTNLLGKLISDYFLDETDSIDIFHTHGGEPFEGEGVIGHRFHCMSIEIPMFLDGELKYVNYFDEDGMALRQRFDFPMIGNDIPVFPYPHPEQLTMPKYIKLNRVTNKGSVLPIAYYELTSELCRLGFAETEPLMVKGQEVRPYDFAVAYIIKARERILKETGFGRQRGAMSVVVKGTKTGQPQEYRVHMVSSDKALGEGTGIPAAVGAILLGQGRLKDKGVLPPEACVDPNEFIDVVKPLMGMTPAKDGQSTSSSIMFEHVDEKGTVTALDF
ncbi:MAG: saccharopine dehydrogenase NADP-binding domain-containing protein [Deltaproteobacteria bacterium]|jgi:saccharopine dehydrogenase (NAD+, L-lysine-forming)|nr:saccharopine dehydrogenase NADP-binding domain-containing protein [Deltaproteobacteria bacterium]